MWKQIKNNYKNLCNNNYGLWYEWNPKDIIYVINILANHWNNKKTNIIYKYRDFVLYDVLLLDGCNYEKIFNIMVINELNICIIEPSKKQLNILKLYSLAEKYNDIIFTIFVIIFIVSIMYGNLIVILMLNLYCFLFGFKKEITLRVLLHSYK